MIATPYRDFYIMFLSIIEFCQHFIVGITNKILNTKDNFYRIKGTLVTVYKTVPVSLYYFIIFNNLMPSGWLCHWKLY